MNTERLIENEPDDVLVAERELQVRHPDGSISPVHIEIYKPTRVSDTFEYGCRYRIVGLQSNVIDHKIFGVDSVQALYLCLQTIGARLMKARQKMEVTWPGGEDSDLEFPLPPSLQSER